MKQNYELKHAAHPDHVKQFDTERLRREFLVENIMEPGRIHMVYTEYERYILGGAVPQNNLTLEPIDILRAEYFLERRELGVINVGGTGSVVVDGKEHELEKKEAIYVGKGSRKVIFRSVDNKNPAMFYFNSAPAHKEYPVKKVGLRDAESVELGSLELSNARKIYKLLVNGVIQTCQLQMGLTELKTGSIWNTMPPHLHSRRNEVYFYFDLPEEQAICHFMGDPQETRHIWLKNRQAVISPPWSIHAAAGTSNYTFIWGMAGENLNYGDMDAIKPTELR